jgi:hypothetical protein
MIYAALEHSIRKNLKQQNLFFPDLKNQPEQNPTTRWVFFCFQGIDELHLDNETIIVINIIERQKIILRCLGDPYLKIYS